MISPTIPAWVKQRNYLDSYRVDGRKIAAFRLIAANTGKGEVILYGFTAVFLGDDVIHLVRVKAEPLRGEAIFATLGSPHPN